MTNVPGKTFVDLINERNNEAILTQKQLYMALNEHIQLNLLLKGFVRANLAVLCTYFKCGGVDPIELMDSVLVDDLMFEVRNQFELGEITYQFEEVRYGRPLPFHNPLLKEVTYITHSIILDISSKRSLPLGGL